VLIFRWRTNNEVNGPSWNEVNERVCIYRDERYCRSKYSRWNIVVANVVVIQIVVSCQIIKN
jgi:hypothetical protein